jgi:hypothetical protein
MLGESNTCQHVLILIAIIVLLFVSNKNSYAKCRQLYEGLVPSYCKDYLENKKKNKQGGLSLIPSGASFGASLEDECQENFNNTLKDVYAFNNITNRLRDSTSDKELPLPRNASLGQNMANLPSDNSLNQLLYQDKQSFQQEKKEVLIENPGFSQYWNEFGPKNEQVSENFCVNPVNVRGDSDKCKMSIENLENQSVRTFEHYTNRLKEPVNFNTYKPLAYHAGVTDSDLIPRNYGVLHHQQLDRFKYMPPLSDMDPQYDVPYEFKKETFAGPKKNNYDEFLRENFVDRKVKTNHKDFVKHLKEKNINGNKAKEHSVMSGDANICGSVLARDCFSNLGSCGGASFGNGISSGEAYLQHKSFCQNYCKPVEHCGNTP